MAEGDLVIDLAWNIDSCEIISWCHDHGVLYINTSIELWDPYFQPPDMHPSHLTLYWRHMAAAEAEGLLGSPRADVCR